MTRSRTELRCLEASFASVTSEHERLYERARQVGYLEMAVKQAIGTLEHGHADVALANLRHNLANYAKTAQVTL